MTKQSNYLWVIDAGHGGIDPKTGIYTTAPSKQYDHRSAGGPFIHEGQNTRVIADGLAQDAIAAGYDVVLTYHPYLDWGLSKRTKIASTAKGKEGVRKAIFLSIHHDAAPTPNTGKGLAVYTAPGQDDSDPVAEVFGRHAMHVLPQYRFRVDKSDGDLDKEEKFYVLMPQYNTCHSRILTENLFQDNLEEAKFLVSDAGQRAIRQYHFNAMVECETNKPI